MVRLIRCLLLSLLVLGTTRSSALADWEAHPENYRPSARCGADSSWADGTEDRFGKAWQIVDQASQAFGSTGIDADPGPYRAQVEAVLSEQEGSMPPPAADGFQSASVALLQGIDTALGSVQNATDAALGPLDASRPADDYLTDQVATAVGDDSIAFLAAESAFFAECGPDYWVWMTGSPGDPALPPSLSAPPR